MPLQKQPVSITFAQGLDLKTDPFQVSVGQFLTLVNSVFTTTNRLTKRNGFANITTLPNNTQTVLTTLNDNLIATGSNLYAYSQDLNKWLDRGIVQPIELSTQPLIRVSTSQESPDTAIAPSGLLCMVYIDNGQAYYQLSDSSTGQQIISRVALPSTSVSPRVFINGVYFIITFLDTVGGVTHLQYIAIPINNPAVPGVATDLSSDVNSLSAGYDGVIAGENLYIAWEASGGNLKIAYLTKSLAESAVTTWAGAATLMSVVADSSRQMVYVSYWDSGSTNGYSIAFSYTLAPLMAITQIITTTSIAEITSIAANSLLTILYENVNNYGYDDPESDTIRTDYISKVTLTPPSTGTGVGTPSSPTIILRSVGLASKAFIDISGVIYVLAVYGDINQDNALDDSNQSTYFLIDSTGAIYMRLAYSNAGGYETNQVLPSVSLLNNSYYIPYRVSDFLATVNKGTNLPVGTPSSAIYTQYGINLSQITINTSNPIQYSSEIAGALQLTGGQVWEYDGVKPVEFGFQVWPENISYTSASTGGSLSAQQYYYVFTYEWTDNAGNLHRSAPSIPILVDLSASMTSTNEATLYVPTDRLTYKISPNPIRIVGYRWSTAQQVYYQFTSVTSPVINSTTIDYVTIVDTNSDAAILGQTLLYTTGGVVEDIAPPACIHSTMFDNRMWLIDAEDPNLLWFSKQVIEAVPVEFSDLLTIYVAPTIGSQQSTGPSKALSPMDDKLIIFKADAAYYINGTGPDNTGANSQYSEPIFITSAVGCSNPRSIVLIPNGLMFQSDKGIWILGRDLQTQYIGAPVEQYNNYTVMSATSVPGTTQVRFILSNNITLMYDYFFNQWGTHTNISAISATLYQNKHTYLNSFGQIYQETQGVYIDASTPVLMSLTTSWINIAGLQGFERFYFANVLGTYFTPFKLNVSFAYNYNPSPIQSVQVLPDNYAPSWGGEAQWGSGASWGSDQNGFSDGGSANVFSARIFPVIQKCQSFQVTIQEVYDATLGVAPGEGLTLSGLALVVGVKKGYRTQSAAKSFG